MAIDRNKIYCYKCNKEVVLSFNNCGNSIYSCQNEECKNSSLLVFSEKYDKWLVTRQKSKELVLKSAENTYQKNLNKKNNTIQNRINLIKSIDKGENKTKYIQDGSYYGYVESICSKCNCIFQSRYDRFLERYEQFDNKIEKILCSDCIKIESNKKAAGKRTGPGFCSHCGLFCQKRDSSCLCSKCRSKKSKQDRKNNEEPGICKNCGKFNKKRNNVGLGIECKCSENMYKQRGMKIKYCNICNEDTLHNEGICIQCNPNAKPGNPKLLISGKPNFTVKDNVKYYKDEPVEIVCKEILNGKRDINNYPGFNIRFGEVYYNTTNILTGNILLLRNILTEKDNVLYYYDQNIQDYIPWEDYKVKFINQNSKINILNLPEGFKLYTTFRLQDSEDWYGSKQAFEQNLVDDKIYWFVYIKFYINKNKEIKPLVVGKSGSLLVNSNGSDVSFSTDINHGPARRFLLEESLDWCKTQAAILPCETEQEALEKEKIFQKEMSLFGS